MARTPTLDENTARWWKVFDSVREELTPPPLRALYEAMTEKAHGEGSDVATLTAWLKVSELISVNDGVAAQVAASLVRGVREPDEA